MFENQSHCIFAPGELSSIISQNFVPVKVFFEKNPDPPSLDKKNRARFSSAVPYCFRMGICPKPRSNRSLRQHELLKESEEGSDIQLIGGIIVMADSLALRRELHIIAI